MILIRLNAQEIIDVAAIDRVVWTDSGVPDGDRLTVWFSGRVDPIVYRGMDAAALFDEMAERATPSPARMPSAWSTARRRGTDDDGDDCGPG